MKGARRRGSRGSEAARIGREMQRGRRGRHHQNRAARGWARHVWGGQTRFGDSGPGKANPESSPGLQTRGRALPSLGKRTSRSFFLTGRFDSSPEPRLDCKQHSLSPPPGPAKPRAGRGLGWAKGVLAQQEVLKRVWEQNDVRMSDKFT